MTANSSKTFQYNNTSAEKAHSKSQNDHAHAPKENIATMTSWQTTSSSWSEKANTNDHSLEVENSPPDTDSTSHNMTENPDVFPDGGLRAYLVVLGSFLGLTVVYGFLNSIGVF